MNPVYLDYAATTPLDPRVLQKMLGYLTPHGAFGNPASTHVFGQAAKEAVELARAQVAYLIGAESSEIIWTSGTTESINLALKGAAELYQGRGKHIVTVSTEHPAVLECCQQLEKAGFFVTYLAPEKNGLLDFEKYAAALRPDTILVSIMHVNNETGVIQDLAKIAEMTAARGILLHVDAAQSVGKLPINLKKLPIDLMSFCAHKLYGPKGIGALYVRQKPRVRVAAQLHGGGQEQGMRSGTLATHQIVGMGEACAIAAETMQAELVRIHDLREELWQGMPRFALNTDLAVSVPTILNVNVGMPAQEFMREFPELAISSGSACHSRGNEPSYVLRALGQTREEALCGVRFSLGRFTTADEIKAVVRTLNKV